MTITVCVHYNLSLSVMWKSSESQSENFPLTHFSSRITEARAQPHNNKLSNKRRERTKISAAFVEDENFPSFSASSWYINFPFFGNISNNKQHTAQHSTETYPLSTVLCAMSTMWNEGKIYNQNGSYENVDIISASFLYMDGWMYEKHHSVICPHHHVYLSFVHDYYQRTREIFFNMEKGENNTTTKSLVWTLRIFSLLP